MSPRSYIINVWEDYFPQGADLLEAVPESAIRYPSETISFGEKKTDSGEFFMNASTDYMYIERGRHAPRKNNAKAGGSNYAFADGSARFLKYRDSLYPLNFWAITDLWRKNLARKD